jgi:hypothetical protein
MRGQGTQQQQRRPRPRSLQRGAAAVALAVLCALSPLLRGAAALKATIHPAATECFTEYVSAEHLEVSSLHSYRFVPRCRFPALC